MAQIRRLRGVALWETNPVPVGRDESVPRRRAYSPGDESGERLLVDVDRGDLDVNSGPCFRSGLSMKLKGSRREEKHERSSC